MGRVVVVVVVCLAACTDFQFADDLRCSSLGKCPPGYFCDTSIPELDVCRKDLPGCGDGEVTAGEVCDDGNRASGDGCRADCLKEELCGDGVVDPGEACDDGPANANTGACTLICERSRCGDGFVQAGEACDDGNAFATDACPTTCQPATCGDGFVRVGEELCDDGAANGTGACSSSCRPAHGVAQIVAGGSHVCVVFASGKLRCWGTNNNFGALGYGHTDNIGDDEVAASAGNIDVGGAVVQVATTNTHTCAVLANGAVRCWGRGVSLGYGTTANIGDDEAPAVAGNVAVGSPALQVVTGGEHTCALLAGGRVRCWGFHSQGRLGTGDLPSQPALVPGADVAIGGVAVQLTAGDAHTCVLLDTGRVRCWGAGGEGQLGYGNTTDIGDDETPASAGEVDVGGVARQLVAGAGHTCALLEGGRVRCWGYGGSGQLGYASTASIGDDEPPASAGDVDVGGIAVQLAAGGQHTCALLDTGRVRCWGESGSGQLGYGSTLDIGDNETPASAGDVDVGEVVVQITAGAAHTCARLVDGRVTCWGEGAFLGYGTTTRIGDDETPASAGAVPIGVEVVRVVAGAGHTCVLLAGGAVRCWGTGADGRLGVLSPNIGDDELAAMAPRVDVGEPVIDLFARTVTYALLDGGRLRCWGPGGCGYPNTSVIGDDETPASMGDLDLGGPAVQVASFGASCAVLTNGKLRCWGQGDFGRLGYGNTNTIGDDEPPASAGDVDVGGAVVQVASGANHTCAVLDTGRIRCWGSNSSGQRGIPAPGNIGDDETPASVGLDVAIPNAVQVATGLRHTCALLTTGNVRCWGNSVSGQTGYGNTVDVYDPAAVGDVSLGGGAVVQIEAGVDWTCARLATKKVRCWGEAGQGQLGYGNTNDIGDNELPSSAGDLDLGGDVEALSVGVSHACALLTNGTLRCWGSGTGGMLGYGNTNNIGDNETPASAGPVPLW